MLKSIWRFKDELFKALNLKNSKCLDYKLFRIVIFVHWFVKMLFCNKWTLFLVRASFSKEEQFWWVGNEIKSHISNSGMFGYDNAAALMKRQILHLMKIVIVKWRDLWIGGQCDDLGCCPLWLCFDKLVMYWYLKEL